MKSLKIKNIVHLVLENAKCNQYNIMAKLMKDFTQLGGYNYGRETCKYHSPLQGLQTRELYYYKE